MKTLTPLRNKAKKLIKNPIDQEIAIVLIELAYELGKKK